MTQMPTLRDPEVLPAVGPFPLHSAPGTATQSQLRDLLAMLRRRWRVVAGLALGAVFVMAVATAFMPSRYAATAVVHVKNQPPQVTNIQQVVAPPSYFEGVEFFQDQVKFLESRTLAATVIRDLGLDQNQRFLEGSPPRPLGWVLGRLSGAIRTVKGWLVSEERPDADEAGGPNPVDLGVPSWLIGLYQRDLIVKPVTNSRLIEVRFTSRSPALAQQVANAHVAAYIRRGLQSKFELTGEARRFLENEIERVQNDLAYAETALNDFRRQHNVVTIDDRDNAVSERLTDLARRVTEAEAARITAEADHRLVQSREYDSLPSVISSPLVQNLKQEIGRLEIREAELGQTFLPASPQMKEISGQLRQARARLGREVSRTVAGIESTYLAAKAKEDQLRAELDRQQAAVLDLKEISGQYVKLEQNVTTTRNLYGTLLTRLQETDVVKGVQLSNASVMDPAERPDWPSEPNVLFNLGFALCLGLGFGVALALVLDHLDGSLKSPLDVREALRLPTLGVVPDFARLPGPRTALLQPVAPGALPAEAYRSIRTSLLFMNPDRPLRTLLVTSSQAQEGKTSTTVNLACSLAQLGQRVVVVDADLRQARCHRLLGVPPGPGVAEVLRGQIALPDAIVRLDGPPVDLLRSGEEPPIDPAELLASPRMEAMLMTLSTAYDVVLVDSPPVFPITDSAILAPRVDGVLMVVRGHRTDREVTREALERLHFMRANVVGVVLNGVDPGSSHYKSYSHYYAA